MSRNVRTLSGRKGLDDNLFERLAEVPVQDGQFDTEKLHDLADKFLVGNANVYGAASFYDFLAPERAGKKAFVCVGSACLVAGTQGKLREELEQHFRPDEIGEVYCLGRCHENAAFHFDGLNYSGAAISHFSDIKNDGKAFPDEYRVGSLGAGLLTTAAPSFEKCLADLPAQLNGDREQILEEITTSGLRGRGGAGFPLGIKLAAVRKENAEQKYIVCNADEGDPGAFSDRYILEQRPHLLLAGMALAGFVTGATDGVVYIRAEYPEAIAICREAVEKFNQIFPFTRTDGEVVSFKLHVVKAQGAYICGEETALLSSLEGLRPEVRTRPPFPVQYGLFGKPTAVNNVETLANIPAILGMGGAAFRQIGTAKSTGTKLLSLDSRFNRPGLYEVDMGTPLGTALHELGGGFREPVKAFHIGGPLGGLVPMEKVGDLTIDFESFAQNGFLLGHASILCIPARFPIVEYIEHLFAFTAHESCGKCFPCRIGSTRGKELLQKAQTSQFKIDRRLFDDLLETLEKGSLCALGGGLPLPVKNAMRYFEGELRGYFK
ncbi:MAG: NADH-ubiquinone oxidoreductase-F iron-sulfur binding region domain-containing protein [Saprospiraceae bacterium]